jgi:alpha-1,2-mannosyltransferase
VQKRVRLAFAFLIFGAMLVSEPFRETLLFGQNNAAVLLFILLSFFFSQKKASRYHIVGGIFFGIATALKVFPVFLLIYFLCKKQWVVSGVGVCVFLLFLIAGTFGHIQYIWDYIHFSRTVISSSVAISKDQSFSSLLLFTFPYMQNFQTTITMGVYASSVFVCSVLWKKLPKELLSDFFFFSSVLGCTILIITPLAWIHHLLFVFPFCIFLFAQAVSKKDTFSIVLFLLTLFLILFNGEYVILFLRSRHFTEIPFIQFHALLGLFIGLIGEYIYLTYSKA